ncbi:ATP-dependent DNA helicase [Bacillus marinisedimentorum]|uniref:ATP-dependent DNA helicase n=1 Tax=Bacillus marinisedimentorum TaxID=1821260 RepID=UPI003CCC01E9
MAEMTKVRISVRTLVEYVYRSGSLETGFRTNTALHEGTKAHLDIQGTYSEQDRKEVSLKTEVEQDDILFTIEGRADGLLDEDGKIVIDEIKSTSRPLEEITAESHPVYWAQAKCYAYIYALDQGMDNMTVQLTYVSADTGELKKFRDEFSVEELETFLQEVVEGYAPYARLMADHRAERDRSIAGLDFPFENYREGQRQFAGTVYKGISDKKDVFAQAPTGIGKTISAVFPSIKAMGEGLLNRLFYLTAKTITREAAEDTLNLMRQKGLNLHAVTITAKDKICFKDEAVCSKEHCEFADGHYDRINGAVLDILENEQSMNRPVIERYAQKHRVCPFEYQLELAYSADAVICDYNYVFDPRVSLKRFLEEQKKHTVLLIDEAHNLVDRARSMFSAELLKSDFLNIRREFKGKNDAIYRAAQDINSHLLRVKKQCAETGNRLTAEELDEEFIALLERFSFSAEQELASGGDGEEGQALLDTYFSALAFTRIAQLYDERFITYAETFKSEVRYKLLCLDPSHLLQKTGKRFRCRVYFSATFSPLGYYQDMLGGNREEDYSVSLPSPFARENTDVYIRPLSTRYRDRERTSEPIAETVSQLIQERPGNYLVFFPSYQYMNMVYDEFVVKEPDTKTIIQAGGMPEEEREQFLASFQADTGSTLVGFAVLGGIFSEGVDLKGDRLNGVIVVGVGLPQIGHERNIIKEYFNKTGKNGYDYAYVYPGMNKVLQAGGRLIRSEDDHGVIVLIDDRFLQRKYQSLLPEEWRHYTVIQ